MDKFWISLVIIFLSAIFIFNQLDNTSKDQITRYSVNDRLSISENDKNHKPMMTDNFSKIYYPHWNHLPLTYSFVNFSNCQDYELKEMKDSIRAIENVTEGIISFTEVGKNPDIIFRCINIENEIEQTKKCKMVSYSFLKKEKEINIYEEGGLNLTQQRALTFKPISLSKDNSTYELCYVDKADINFPIELVSQSNNIEYDDEQTWGQSLPYMIENNIIKNLTINYYYKSGVTCGFFPSRGVHELLHGFGFDHIKTYDPKDILYPELSCQFQIKINEKYVNCLKYIYTNGEYANCSGVNFIGSDLKCESGYPALNEYTSCCPNANMIVEGDYCVYP